jgi:hypothetical protein
LTSNSAIRKNKVSHTGTSEFVIDVIDETIRKNRRVIKLLEDTISFCQDLFIDLEEAEHHEDSLTGGRAVNTKKKSKKQKEYTLRLVKREGQSIDIIFDILDELTTALSDLITGDYRGVFRSLRLVIEFLVFWAGIEGDGRTGVDAYREYSRRKLTDGDFSYDFNVIRQIKLARIKERLIIKEKQRDRAIQNMTSAVSIISGKEGQKYLFRKEQIKKAGIEEQLTMRTRIKEKIEEYYSYFSAFSHVTHVTLNGIRESKPHSYGSYEKAQFTECSSYLWKVIDLVIVVFVIEKSRFYGYSFSFDFLKVCVTKNDFVNGFFFNFLMPNKIEAKLPMMSMMMQVLRIS